MQDNLPPLPEMNPIPYVPSEPAERSLPPIRPGSPPAFPIGRRLRQVLGMLAGGGFLLTAGIGVLEVTSRPEFKPSTLVANFEAGVERSLMNQKMGQAPGSLVLTEADYRQKLAEAERQGQASAELAFQQKLAVVQADKERIVQAYATLYQRTNMIAQGAIQLEGQAQQFRQQLIAQSSDTKSAFIKLKDIGCQIGLPGACEAAKADRKDLIAESDELSQANVGQRIKDLLQGIDDPATVAVHKDQQRTSTFGTPPQR